MVDHKKISCPTKGCSGQGNMNNMNYEGHHSSLSSCPLAFLNNKNENLISNLRIEILQLKTELNVDMPRYVDQIDSLTKMNSELKLKIQQMSDLIDTNNIQIKK